ncbi:hypothetical protein B0H14DRAFT_2563623 [Mycena olivaceomarginata]|nr:hypothetical protein B0H14DRAFT_2563623 [Mycena olivaceomarginata]
MRDLWNHELDANEHEAAYVGSILSRFYQWVMKSKCDVECNGVPILILRSKGPNQYGKTYFVGCSKWHPSQCWSHTYHTIPPNVDEDTFKYVLEHAGRLPEDTPDINVMCTLTLHPRIKLKACYRFKRRITFARLYCNKKSAAAFHQLFYELFDSIHRVTGQKLKLCPFFPDANGRIIMLDGEVAQALGLGSFLVTYNQPVISNIHTTDPIELLSYMLKTCTVHFQRHIDELSKSDVPQDVLTSLKSILGLASQEEIDAWHAFCTKWYLQKQRNSWYLPSVNQYLSKISLDDWKITPRTTNIAETSHAATNADTSTQLPLLPAILVTQERDKDDVEEIHQIVRDGIMCKHWNGPSERKHLSDQRAGWSARQREERNDDLATYDALAKDREEGQEEWRFSLTRGHALQEQIQLVQAELKLDKRRTDLSEELKTLRAALEFEKQARRDWVTQRGEIDTQMKVLRAGPLKDDLNNGQLEYFPSDFARNTTFELDPALEPNYHALGGSDYAIADYNVSGSDYVLPLPPPSPPVQPPDTSAPSDTSGPSRTRRRKREQEVDPANEVEGKRSRTALRQEAKINYQMSMADKCNITYLTMSRVHKRERLPFPYYIRKTRSGLTARIGPIGLGQSQSYSSGIDSIDGEGRGISVLSLSPRLLTLFFVGCFLHSACSVTVAGKFWNGHNNRGLYLIGVNRTLTRNSEVDFDDLYWFNL